MIRRARDAVSELALNLLNVVVGDLADKALAAKWRDRVKPLP